jgi:hypothetical protein
VITFPDLIFLGYVVVVKAVSNLLVEDLHMENDFIFGTADSYPIMMNTLLFRNPSLLEQTFTTP